MMPIGITAPPDRHYPSSTASGDGRSAATSPDERASNQQGGIVCPWNVGDLRKLAADPDGLVLDSKLRRDVLTCGELAQACYDSCETEASSFRRCWNIFAAKPEKIQDAVERQRIIKDSVPIRSGAAAFAVKEEFFANAGFYSLAGSEPNKLLKKLTLRAWRDLALEPERKIWVGFSAEYGDDSQGYDVVICWRGTVYAEEWTVNLLGDVLSYWEEEPTWQEKWLCGKLWWASRVHFGFKQLYCTHYEPQASEAAASACVSVTHAEGQQPGMQHNDTSAHSGPAMTMSAQSSPIDASGSASATERAQDSTGEALPDPSTDPQRSDSQSADIPVWAEAVAGPQGSASALADSAFAVANSQEMTPSPDTSTRSSNPSRCSVTTAERAALEQGPASIHAGTAKDESIDSPQLQVRRLVQRLIRDMKSGRKNIRSITVTGHSLGGALAVLCADDIGRQLQCQQRLDEAVGSCSAMLQRLRNLPAVRKEAQAAIEQMERCLELAQKVGTDIVSSRCLAAAAVDVACLAVKLLRQALLATSYVKAKAGQLNKQEHRTQDLLDLLAEAQILFNDEQLSSVGPAAIKLRKAAKAVPYKQGCPATAPLCDSAIGRVLSWVRSTISGQMRLQTDGRAKRQPAAHANSNAALSATQPAKVTVNIDAAAQLGLTFDEEACPTAEELQHDDDSDSGWKLTLEAAAAHCAAAAALAMVMAQFADPAPKCSREPSCSTSSSTPSGDSAPRDSTSAHDELGRSRAPESPRSPATPETAQAGSSSSWRRLQLQLAGEASLRNVSLSRAAGPVVGCLQRQCSDALIRYQSLQRDSRGCIDGLSAAAVTAAAAVNPCMTRCIAGQSRMPAIRAVTFAAPHVGNAAFVRRLEGRGVQVLRVVNKWDIIPHAPGAIHVLTAIAMLWLRRTPRYRLNSALRFMLQLLPWWAYDDTRACLLVNSSKNTLMKSNMRHKPAAAHNLEGYLFLIAAQYRRWTMPRATNDSDFDLFVFTTAVCVCIAYAGFAMGVARALSGHVGLTMPGLLLPTLLAIMYSAAGAVLGAGLVMGAVLGSHWCDVIVLGFLGQHFRRWVRQPKQRTFRRRMGWITSVLGFLLGPVVGAVASLLAGIFFIVLLAAYLVQSVMLYCVWYASSLLVAVGWIFRKVSQSGLQAAAMSVAAGMSKSAVEKVEKLQDNKDGFDRRNYQQKMGEVLQVTGRAPALLNKNSSVLNPVLGVPPNWWVQPLKSMQNRNGQWRERRNETLRCFRDRFGTPRGSVFAEGDRVTLHHQLDRHTDTFLRPIAQATVMSEPDNHVPSPVDSNVKYVKLIDPHALFNSKTRSMLDDALRFAFPLAQHLRNIDQVEGCLWWPEDGLCRTKPESTEERVVEPQTPSTAVCVLDMWPWQAQRHSNVEADVERPHGQRRSTQCDHSVCAILSVVRDPVSRAHHAPCPRKPIVRQVDETDLPLPGLWRRKPSHAFATCTSM